MIKCIKLKIGRNQHSYVNIVNVIIKQGRSCHPHVMTYLIDNTVINAFDHNFPPNLRWVSCCVTHLCDTFVTSHCAWRWRALMEEGWLLQCSLHILAIWFPFCVSRDSIGGSEVIAAYVFRVNDFKNLVFTPLRGGYCYAFSHLFFPVLLW